MPASHAKLERLTLFSEQTNFIPVIAIMTDCERYQYANNGVCGNCGGNCWGCSASDPNKCTGCHWDSTTELYNGPAQLCNGACSSGNNPNFGRCDPCPNGCSSCQYYICQTTSCGASDFLFIDKQVCCDLGSQKYFDGTTCTSCHASCDTCSGGAPQDCLTCAPGYAMDYALGTCVATCDGKNGKFYDGTQCRDCQTGCKECVNSNTCLVCDQSLNYFLEKDHTCSLCPVTNKKFHNTLNYPPTCDSCEAGCLECSDEQTCTKCDAPGGFYLSSGDCLTCDLKSAKFIPST